jgi:ribosome-associated protein
MAKKDRRSVPEWEQEPEEVIIVSKTEMKNDMLALQKMGTDIVNLSKGDFSTIPITDETLAHAIHTARRIKSREGLRRQMQYIGKLLRAIDTTEIEKAFQHLQDGRRKQNQHFQQLEQWRDQLIEQGPSAIEDIIEKYPHGDRQHLRQLITSANKEQTQNKPPASARKLFRYLKELDENQITDD